jgi:C4-dicarboxylate transporter DctM subunit
VLEGIPAIVILMPTLEPTVKALGINQLHYDILVVAATGVGLFLPPIGIGVLIATAIGQAEVSQVTRAFLPYLAILLLGLVLLVLVPELTLFLPRLAGVI